MNPDLLLSELKALYGAPRHATQMDYRWDVRPPQAMAPVHLCVNLEQLGGKTSIWIFDPRRVDQSATCLQVRNQTALRNALDVIRSRLAHADGHVETSPAPCAPSPQG